MTTVGRSQAARARSGRAGAAATSPRRPSIECDQRGLLAGDVGPGALEDLDVEVDAGAVDVAAEVPAARASRDRGPQRVAGPRDTRSARSTIPVRRPAGEGGQRHALEHAVRVALHQQPVDERARVALVAVADQVARPVTRRLRAAPHLTAAGKPAPPRPRRPDALTSWTTRSRSALGATASHTSQGSGPAPTMPARTTGSGTSTRTGICGSRRRGIAGELVDEVGARAGVLVVEGGRDRRSSSRGSRRARATPTPSADTASRLGAEVPREPSRCAAVGREARRPGANANVTPASWLKAEIGIEGRGAVDVGPREAELGGDPVDVARLDQPASVLRLAQAGEDLGATAAVTALDLGDDPAGIGTPCSGKRQPTRYSALLHDRVDDALGDVDHHLADTRAAAVELAARDALAPVLDVEQARHAVVVRPLEPRSGLIAASAASVASSPL